MAYARAPASLSVAAFFVLLATLFFWLSAFSVPFIKSISYLHTSDGMKFGNFGWCDGPICYRHVGYAWYPEVLDKTHLTGSLILVAITAGFGSLAFLSLVHSIVDLASGFCSFTLTLISALLSSISFLLVVICWGVAHHRFSDNGLDPKYGSAFALVIVGWVLYLLAIPFVVIGWFRERHYRREVEAASTRRRWF
ncbi:hypothetical protein JCM24511_00848 [Saitozyma sp. JCM 24511]|nr:hypothetical protein JCM24511_00848 [Saitozyma sp. JCM 24511]